MSDPERITVPGWMTRVVPAVVALVLMTVGFLAWGDARFVLRSEWISAEAREAKEVSETALALSQHIRDSKDDSIRMARVEEQLAAIREDLSWFRRRLERTDPKVKP